MMPADPLVQARDAARRRDWTGAYEHLSAAHRQGRLPAVDLDRLATAAYLTGRLEEAVRHWEHAHDAFTAAGDRSGAVRCGFWLGLTLLLAGQQARGGSWLARARRTLEDMPAECVEAGYLKVPAALRILHGGDPAGALTEFDAVVDIAERFGSPDLDALGRLGRGQVLVAMGRAADGIAELDDAMLTVTTTDVSPIVAGIVYCAVIIACRDVFDLSRAQEWTAALSSWCAGQQGLQPYQGQCLVHRSEIMQLRGDWSAAMAEVRRAWEHMAAQPVDPAMGSAMYQHAELLRLRGEFDQAQTAYGQAAHWGHGVQPGLALLRLAQGRHTDAAMAVRRVVAETSSPVERARVLSAYAEVMLAIGEMDEARSAADELMRAASGFDSPYLRAVAGYAHGTVLLAVGDVVAAGDVLRRTWTSWGELEAPYEAARTRVMIGLVYRQSGDDDSAQVEWDGARRVFERLAAAPDLARLAELRRPGPRADGLTDRELDVLALLATGMTNSAIAARLVISEHTVRRHVQNIFAKLGLASRAAATAYAYEHHLARRP